MTNVYQIVDIGSDDNKFTTGRTVTWELKLINTFKTINEAKKYN